MWPSATVLARAVGDPKSLVLSVFPCRVPSLLREWLPQSPQHARHRDLPPKLKIRTARYVPANSHPKSGSHRSRITFSVAPVSRSQAGSCTSGLGLPPFQAKWASFGFFFRQTCYDQLARQTIPSILTGRHSCMTRFMWHKHTCSVALPMYRRRSNTCRHVPKPIALAPLCRTTGCGASFLPGFCAWLHEVTHAKMRS